MIKHSCPTIGNREARVINAVLKTKYLSQGNVVRRFEESVVNYLGGKGIYAIAVNSGSSALHLSLLSLGIKKTDEVIIPSYACSALLNAINYISAKPVLADINEDDFNISFDSVNKKITSRTKAIIVAHLFGFPADMDRFSSLKIPVIEDCAQTIGATYKNKPVGTFGKLSVFSFYATKVLTTGYGGMVISQDYKLIDKILDRISYDNRDDYLVRYNYQMSELSAGLGLAQLDQLDTFIKKRSLIAKKYRQSLQSIQIEDLVLPTTSTDTEPIFYRYVIRHPRSEKLMKQLRRYGIEAKRPVYKPLHHYLKLDSKDFPNTEIAHRNATSLPIYPSLTNRQLNYIIDKVIKTLISV
jgi:dTDP-4-amino-4,6-dideoxygalactose transaminase